MQLLSLHLMHEKAYGIIPLRQRNHVWQVLLVYSRQGFWGLPKGHAEAGETPQQTATRELFEETHLSIKRYLSEKIYTEQYTFRQGAYLINKTVFYFFAEVKGRVFLQSEELQAFDWVLVEQAANSVTYPATKKVLIEAVQNLQK